MVSRQLACQSQFLVQPRVCTNGAWKLVGLDVVEAGLTVGRFTGTSAGAVWDSGCGCSLAAQLHLVTDFYIHLQTAKPSYAIRATQ
jgi:hypothetical protein